MKNETSVDVKLFHWLTQYLLDHPYLINRKSDDHVIIRNYLNNTSSINHSDAMDPIIHKFTCWLFALVTLFDGGLFSESVRSFTASSKSLSFVWHQNISHELSLLEWNRPTRKAINYIAKRSSNIDDASKNILNTIQNQRNYLMFYKNKLAATIQSFDQFNANHSLDTANHPYITYMWLSSLPIHCLDPFFLNLSTQFSPELSVTMDHHIIKLHDYFKTPSSTDFFLIEKVKLYYNIMLFSSIDQELKNRCNELCSEFLNNQRQNSQYQHKLLASTKQITNDILHPRHQLLTMVFDQLLWNN